jgi:hypothetical protein
MKEIIGISAIAILCGIADARAEERVTSNNILPAAATKVQYYSRQGYRQRYRRLGYRRSPYGGIVRRRGPYIQELGPAGPTGPLGPHVND